MANDFTLSVKIPATPEAVYNALLNPRAWWSQEIQGKTETAGDVYHYHYQDIHKCTIKLDIVDRNKKLEWLVLDNYFNFIKDQSEWCNTRILFELEPAGNETVLHFKHNGLVPAYECYDICNEAWTGYIGDSLVQLITTGEGKPNPKEN